jgi:hypothetical protein
MPIDPGWCFVLGGLGLVAAALLVPAWRDVQDLQARVSRLEGRIEHLQARQTTGKVLLEALHADDPVVHQRLVAWQWNLVPLGDQAIIRERHDAGLAGWVDARTPPPDPEPAATAPSHLEQLLHTDIRPWVLAGGGLCLLIGIVALPLPGSHDKPMAGSTDR